MSEDARFYVVGIVFLLCGLLAHCIYGRRLDALFCDKNGEPSQSKIGVIVGGASWTYYMLVEMPQDVEMWALYYVCIAMHELAKKLMTMMFEWKTGQRATDSTTKTTDTTVTTKSTATTTP